MISSFAEAVRATTQPCTLLLIAPALLGVIATRARYAALVATLVGAVVGGWVFMANVVALSEAQLRISGLVATGVGLTLALSSRVPGLRWARNKRIEATLAGGLAFLGTLWWRPCVGEELGRILTDAARDGLAGQLLDMAAYMVGAMVPVVMVGLVIRALGPAPRMVTWTTGGALILALLLGGAMALGRHDELVTTLTAWSQS